MHGQFAMQNDGGGGAEKAWIMICVC